MTVLAGLDSPQIRSELLSLSPSVEAAAVSFSNAPDAFVLESCGPTSSYGRYAILGFDAIHRIDIDRHQPAPLDQLAAAWSAMPQIEPPEQLPFVGGWVGYLGYEAGLASEGIELTTRMEVALPLIRLALYDAAAVYDRHRGQWWIAGVEWPPGWFPDRAPLAERLGRLRERLIAAEGALSPLSPEPLGPSPTPCISRASYTDAVHRALEYIRAGDIYQVNLTQRFSTTVEADPVVLYRRLRAANPANFSALLRWGDQAVISSSPELFLDRQGDRVITRPIKGTRPRTGDPRRDAAFRCDLLASEKDHAELAMIVDLLRNDLGKVARYGTVEVVEPARLEEHPTVYHLVATVAARLRAGCTAVDLLRATFPGGSITGAPKIRAMQIIDELEPLGRSAYCGSIGYLGLDGRISLSIAIRTMIYDCGRLHLFAGGGIVADSLADLEYDECRAKAAGMVRALGHDPDRWLVDDHK